MEVSPLVSAFLSFIFVIGLLLLTLWFIRARGVGVATRTSGDLQVMQTLRMGAKHHLSVVRYGDRTLLLGISGQQISLLDNQASDDSPMRENSEDSLNGPASGQPPKSFAANLKSLLPKR
jgi:flagellar biogenesis protein FliO